MKPKVVIAFAVLALMAIAFALLHDSAKPNLPDPLYKGKSASAWVELYIRKEEGEARHAVQSLGAAAVPYLTPELSRRDSLFNGLYIRLWPHLPATLQSRWRRPILNQDIRMRALAVLRDMKPTPSAAVSALMDRLRDKDATIRLHAAIALGNVGPEAKAAVPLMKPFLKEKHTVRVYTAIALWKIEHNTEEILPILEQGVQEQAPFRWAAAVFLGEMGPEAVRAIPLLEKTTVAEDKEAASCAIQALAQISPGTTPILIQRLKDPSPAIRISAAVALEKLGPLAKDAVPALIELLDDKASGAPVIMGRGTGGEPVNKAAASALKRIDPDSRRQGPE